MFFFLLLNSHTKIVLKRSNTFKKFLLVCLKMSVVAGLCNEKVFQNVKNFVSANLLLLLIYFVCVVIVVVNFRLNS